MQIGEKLKEAREEKNMSIDEVQAETKIRKKYLLALENNNFEEIKGQVYVRAFIKGYADLLGLGADKLLTEYEEFIAEQESEEIEEEEEPESFFQENHMKIFILLAVIVISAFLIFNFFIKKQDSNSVNNSLEKQVSEKQVSEKQTEDKIFISKDQEDNTKANNFNDNKTKIKSEKTVNNNSTQKNESEQKNNLIEEEKTNKKTLEIIANQRSWIQVNVDGKVSFQGFIKNDERQRFELDNNNSDISLKIGNAAGIQVKYNEKIYGPWGSSGEVIKKEISIEKDFQIR